MEKTAKYEPTKTTETVCGVFVASPLAIFQKSETEPQAQVEWAENNTPSECKALMADPTQEQVDQAGAVLAKAGVRLIGDVHGVDAVGIWSDLDSAELRAAIATFHPDGVPIRYLDGDDIPMCFKLRKVPGEAVPANVLAAMEREPAEPWKVRDRMLKEMNWTPEGVPWAQYQAERLNKLFQEQGVTGHPGKIRADTVRHSEGRGK